MHPKIGNVYRVTITARLCFHVSNEHIAKECILVKQDSICLCVSNVVKVMFPRAQTREERNVYYVPRENAYVYMPISFLELLR